MLQQSDNPSPISQDSLDFDPYAQPDNHSNHIAINVIEDSSSSSSSSDDETDTYYEPIQRQIKQHNIQQGKQEAQEPLRSKTKIYHENTFTKLDTKINLHKITNEIGSCEQKEMVKQKKNKDKADRATVEQVLDERTRRILLKLINNQIVHQINGCISTGKEANVYHAINNTTKKQYAIKIYKTSILVFKDRDRYVEGEFRFRRGYCSSNPRKMVSMWAEKQLRNLKRMQGVIRSPVGLLVKSNVLVMDFIGKDLINAPRLKDASIEGVEQWSEIYLEVLKIMRVLYQECKLIHADLSEYNMLFYQKEVFVIDVSQSVEHDHPHALDFLRRDITNINDFFKKRFVNVFSDWNVFQFIVAVSIAKGQELKELQDLMDGASEIKKNSDGRNVEDQVFKRITIPRTLGNIPMEKVEKELFGGLQVNNYSKVVAGVGRNNQIPEEEKDSQESSGSSSDSDSEQAPNKQDQSPNTAQQATKVEGQPASEQQQKGKTGGKQKYEGLSKLDRKHKVKQQKREKRKDKVPKKQKKRLTKKN